MAAKEFGAKIRELRRQARMTQKELAEKVDIDFTYLSKIETGVMPPPSEKVILRLAEVLNTDKDELMTLAGRVPPDVAQLLSNPEALQLVRSQGARKIAGVSHKIQRHLPRQGAHTTECSAGTKKASPRMQDWWNLISSGLRNTCSDFVG